MLTWKKPTRQRLRHIQDNSDEFYMLPAWEFSGEVQVGESYKMDLGVIALINGLDGSVIDVALGY